MNRVVSRLEDGVFPVVHSLMRDDIGAMISSQLEQIEGLTPLQESVLVESIVRRYRDASIKQHEPVGVNAALTTGENLTQSSLQSHHHAGLKRGAAGFDRIEEITDMRNKSNIAKVITTPHQIVIGDRDMHVPRSKSEINEIANLLVKVLLDDVVIDYHLLSLDDVPYPSWYKIYSAINAIPISSLKKKWLRIFLNPEKIYKHRISLPAIALVITESIGDGGYALYPPSQIGLYIDVHVNVGTDADYYLKLSNILSLQIGGIESVESATPIPENLLTNLRIREVDISDTTDCPRVYECVSSAPAFIPPFVWERMIKAMIPDAVIIDNTSGRRFCSAERIERIREMMLQTPLIYADIIASREIVPLPDVQQYMIDLGDPRYASMIQDGSDVIRITFQQDIINRYPYLEHADLEPRFFRTDEEANHFLLEVMVEYHFFWYIEAICERVQDLYILPEVDSTRTYTTSALDCKDTLGYMAMRTMIYREFIDNIGINPIHVKLIINNMTLYKEPVSIRRQSVRNDKSEWMTYTTFEDVLKYITFAAFAGEEDNMQSVSSHVLTGRMINIGRGGMNLPKTSRDNPTGNSFLELKIQSERERTTTSTRGRGVRRGRRSTS